MNILAKRLMKIANDICVTAGKNVETLDVRVDGFREKLNVVKGIVDETLEKIINDVYPAYKRACDRGLEFSQSPEQTMQDTKGNFRFIKRMIWGVYSKLEEDFPDWVEIENDMRIIYENLDKECAKVMMMLSNSRGDEKLRARLRKVNDNFKLFFYPRRDKVGELDDIAHRFAYG